MVNTNPWQDANPAKDENVKIYLNALFENQKQTIALYLRSYYLILVLIVGYWLLRSLELTGATSNSATENTKVELLSFEVPIKDIAIILWAIPLIMAFVCYRAFCALSFSYYIDEISTRYFNRHLPEFSQRGLTLLAVPFSFLNYERFQQINENRGSTVAKIISLIIIAIFLFGPFLLMVIMLILNIISEWDRMLEFPYLLPILLLINILVSMRTALLMWWEPQHLGKLHQQGDRV